MTSDNLLLDVKGLKTYFYLDEGTVKAVDGVDFTIKRGKTLCVVGESGCGKSVTARSIMQIVDPPGRIIEGQMIFHRKRLDTGISELDDVIDLAKMKPNSEEIRKIRGKEIAMIFQEPMTSAARTTGTSHPIRSYSPADPVGEARLRLRQGVVAKPYGHGGAVELVVRRHRRTGHAVATRAGDQALVRVALDR